MPVAAPFDGVITKWRFRGGCCTDKQTESKTMTLGTFKQGTQDGLSGYGYVIPVAKGPSFVIPAGNVVLSDPAVELPARMPIAAGERIGIIADHPIAFASYAAPNVTLSIITTGTVYNGEPYGVAYSAAMAINAEIEADGDGDGYGDETQDCVPGDPTRHEGNCGPPPAPTPPGLLSVGKQGPCEGICGGGGVDLHPPAAVDSRLRAGTAASWSRSNARRRCSSPAGGSSTPNFPAARNRGHGPRPPRRRSSPARPTR